MESHEIKKYQQFQLRLLERTDRICQELGIRYYMIGGTLLGAVRHGGFIPWDADIDIAMRRADYERFRQYWMEAESDDYFYQDHTTEPNHLSPHALLRIKGTHVVMNTRVSERYAAAEDGIYLDIFPLDEPPADKKKQDKQRKALLRIRRTIELKAAYTYGTSTGKLKRLAKKTVQLCLLPLSLTTLNKMLHKQMGKYTGCNSGCLVSMASHYSYWKQLMEDGIYGEPQRISFEGRQFYAPAQTDAYLKKIYGNYMELPPEEKRYSDLKTIAYIDYGTKDTQE